jgi:hypothetical protein
VQSSSEIVLILTSAKNDSPRTRLESRAGKAALYKCGELLVFEPMESKGCAIGLRNRLPPSQSGRPGFDRILWESRLSYQKNASGQHFSRSSPQSLDLIQSIRFVRSQECVLDSSYALLTTFQLHVKSLREAPKCCERRVYSRNVFSLRDALQRSGEYFILHPGHSKNLSLRQFSVGCLVERVEVMLCRST